MPRNVHHGLTEQTKASQHRRVDAQTLQDGDRWRGAMYLAGYAVECLLKAKLMKQYNCHHLQDLEEELHRRGLLPEQATIFTHDIERLLKWTRAIDRLRQNAQLWRTFNLVNRWLPAWRYDSNPANREDAKTFLAAVDTILHWIQNNV